MSTVMKGSQNECTDAANGGLGICLPVEGDSIVGSCANCDHKDARRLAWMAPTELVRRLTWEVVASRLRCQGDLHGEATNGLAK
jgi:hypothetical protein